MGKINKTIKTKAKNAINNALKKCNNATAGDFEGKDKRQLLNKTITPKKITSKKEKCSQKHKKLMNKFSLIKKMQKEEISRKNREKTAIIGDLKPLKDALPSLDEIFKLTKEKDHLKTGIREFDEAAKGEENKLSAKKKMKRKKDKFMRQVNSYQKLLKDPDFKKNPREAIRFHIKYTHGGGTIE